MNLKLHSNNYFKKNLLTLCFIIAFYTTSFSNIINQNVFKSVDSLLFKTLVDSFANYIYSEPNKSLVFANSYLKYATNIQNDSERSHFLSKGYNLKGIVFNYKYSYDSSLYFCCTIVIFLK